MSALIIAIIVLSSYTIDSIDGNIVTCDKGNNYSLSEIEGEAREGDVITFNRVNKTLTEQRKQANRALLTNIKNR